MNNIEVSKWMVAKLGEPHRTETFGYYWGYAGRTVELAFFAGVCRVTQQNTLTSGVKDWESHEPLSKLEAMLSWA